MKRIVGMVAVCVVALGFGIGQVPADRHQDAAEFERLAADLQLLEGRVKRLEERVEQLKSGNGTTGARRQAAKAKQPVLEVTRLSTEFVEPPQEIAANRAEARKLRDKAAKLRKDAAYYSNKTPLKDGDVLRNRRRAQDLREQALDIENTAKRLEGEADRLERQYPRQIQIIHGWNGQRGVVLRTTFDCSEILTGLAPGSFLSWRGTLIRFDDASEEWEVNMITPVERPDDF